MIVLLSHELIYTFIYTKITDSDEFCQFFTYSFADFFGNAILIPFMQFEDLWTLLLD